MNYFYILWTLIHFLSIGKVHGKQGLIITDLSENVTEAGPYITEATLYKRPGDKLKIACALPKNISGRWELSWNFSGIYNKNRSSPQLKSEFGQLILIFDQLQFTDSGRYNCTANEIGLNNSHDAIQNSIKIIVRAEIKCQFSCDSSESADKRNCIFDRYKCDGHKDCLNGKDESLEICGSNPCEDKIPCKERCIPKDWCCRSGQNCTQPWDVLKCCPKIPKGSGHRSNSFSDNVVYHQRSNEIEYDSEIDNDIVDPHHYSSESFLQTTMYTLLSCATVVLLFVTILIITICRTYLRRVSEFNIEEHPRRLPNTFYHRILSSDFQVNGIETYIVRPEIHQSPGLLVTYNINNGVQIVGNPVEPPPYSECMSPPPHEGPPPPYRQNDSFGPNSNHRRYGLSNIQVNSEPALSSLK